MKIVAALLIAFAAGWPAQAQDDPLKSAACGAALAQLQAARTGGSAGDVEARRSAASAACLGSAAVPTRPSRVAQPLVVVPPPQIDLPQRVAPLPGPSLPPPPVAIQRAPLPAQCDAGGCWSNDGTHLRHVPPSLAGPAGLCTQQGGLVYCP